MQEFLQERSAIKDLIRAIGVLQRFCESKLRTGRSRKNNRFEWSKMSGRANTLGVFAIVSQNNSIRLVISLLDVEEMIRTLIKAEYEMKENECLESG